MRDMQVIVGGLMSVDGKIAPADRNGKEFTQFMTQTHRMILHSIRANVDAVIVGVDTVLADNPSLTVREVQGKNPLRVVVDSKARTPPTAKILKTAEAPTMVAVTKSAPEEKIATLRNKKADVFISSGEQTVNLQELMEALKKRGVTRVLVEGGAEVRWSFFKAGLVDELFVWVMPCIWGGRNAPTLVGGDGFLSAEEAKRLTIKSVEQVEGLLVLWFLVEH